MIKLLKNIYKKLNFLVYIFIPIIVVIICRILKIAQGEANEEIVIGTMLGILFDFIYAILNYFISKGKKKNEKNNE